MTRILVIDDQDSIRRLLRRALEQEGHEVLDASDDPTSHSQRVSTRQGDRHLGGDTTGQLDLREGAEL